jgi:ParB-like chromosome segregation protein Spo0J
VEHVPVGDLRTYHRNPRRGNTTVIAQSLTINGQYRCLAVNRGTHTGRPNEVLAGNHTLMAARDLGWDTVAATYVDVDDDQAARIVAADNRTADLAEYDDRLLLELLADLPDLDGTGYDPGDVEALEKLLGAPPEDTPPDEFPPFDEGIKTEFQCPKCSYEWSGKPK